MWLKNQFNDCFLVGVNIYDDLIDMRKKPNKENIWKTVFLESWAKHLFQIRSHVINTIKRIDICAQNIICSKFTRWQLWKISPENCASSDLGILSNCNPNSSTVSLIYLKMCGQQIIWILTLFASMFLCTNNLFLDYQYYANGCIVLSCW